MNEVDKVPPAYTVATTPYYEQIGRAEAVYNRLVAYRNNAFHAAVLEAGHLSPDPREVRLTANFSFRRTDSQLSVTME